MLRFTTTLTALAMVCSCGGDGSDDGSIMPDAGGDVDSAMPGARLLVEFTANPGRESFDGDFDPEINDIQIVLSDVRAIGDAAPGDDRTRIETLTLSFVEGNKHQIQFENAPIGRYSRVRARIDRFVARGECTIAGEELEWEIETEPPGGLELDISLLSVDLEPGEEATLAIEALLDRPYDAVNWDELEAEDDKLRIDDSFGDIAEVRGKIREAFRDASDDDDD